jgi:ATP-dependent Zn protease
MSIALVVCVALCLLAQGALAAEGTITYKHESEPTFQQQLASKQVQSVAVNKRLRTLRVTLKDGTHVLARYPRKQEPQTVARLQAAGVAVSVLGNAAAEKEAKAPKPVHHKLRYIAGGILIAVIVIVGLVLLVNSRRRRD